jgi:hypothetical protein
VGSPIAFYHLLCSSCIGNRSCCGALLISLPITNSIIPFYKRYGKVNQSLLSLKPLLEDLLEELLKDRMATREGRGVNRSR